MTKLITALFVALVFTFPSASAGQVPGANDPDAKELLAYRLTVPVMKQVMAATRYAAEAVKKDPRFAKAAKLQAEIKALGDKEEPTPADIARMEKLQAELDGMESSQKAIMDTNNATLSQLEASIVKEPIFANALRSAGLAPREFAKFTLAFFQAMFIHGFMKGGMIKELPKDVNAENVRFVQEHEAEIAAFMKEMEAFGKGQ